MVVCVCFLFFIFHAWYTFSRRWNSSRQASSRSISVRSSDIPTQRYVTIQLNIHTTVPLVRWFIIMGRAWASKKLLIHYFVMTHGRICHCRVFKPIWQRISSHIYQLFLQPGQLTWLQMNGLSIHRNHELNFWRLWHDAIYWWPYPKQPSQPLSILTWYCLWAACHRWQKHKPESSCHTCFNFSRLCSWSLLHDRSSRNIWMRSFKIYSKWSVHR